MTRIKDDKSGLVHFRNPANDCRTLCGLMARSCESDMFGVIVGDKMKVSSERVDCPLCAKVYCAVKNEPWPSVGDSAMTIGIYDAVKEDTKGDDTCSDSCSATSEKT